MIKVLIDTSPLGDANAIRGVGVYTRLLTEFLSRRKDVEIWRSADPNLPADLTPDVIHYPYFDLFFSTLPLIKKSKRVVTVHDVIPLKFPDFYPSGVKGGLRFQKQKLALKNTSAVITDSKASQADIAQMMSVSSEKVFPIYLAANPEIQKPPQTVINSVKRKYKLPQKYCLYVGDINYNKNLPQLIKAVKFLPRELKLVLVGKSFYPQGIPEWQWIDTQLEMSNVRDRVRFLTQITGDANQDLSAIYAGARVYVQPSLYEGFGLPILEAMQCRTPVVCTRTSSLIEVGGSHVVFADPQAESLAKEISTVFEWSKNKTELFTRQAFKWSQNFSWEKTAQETVNVYKQVLA